MVVRPPLANGALSGFNSDLIREPLAGRDYVCPVTPEATIWIVSSRDAIANLLQLGGRSAGRARRAARDDDRRSLAVSVADIVAALARVDAAAPARIRFAPHPAIEAQFGRWPLDCAFDRAARSA